MTSLAQFVGGSGVMFLILAVLMLEAGVLVLLARRGPRPLALTGMLANLGAGACLVLAMLVIVTDGWWGWIGLMLTAAFAAHLVDLRARLRQH
jgi:hypothetical protein